MSTDPNLEIRGISKRYGETVAVQDLTFDVRAGELFGFVGRNGAGKTTTMRIALGVLAPMPAWCDGWEYPRRSRRAGASATCPRSAGCIRRCDWPSSSPTSASSTA